MIQEIVAKSFPLVLAILGFSAMTRIDDLEWPYRVWCGLLTVWGGYAFIHTTLGWF